MLLLYNYVIARFWRYVGHYSFLVAIPLVWNFFNCPSHPHFPPAPGQLLFILKDSVRIMNLISCPALLINGLRILIYSHLHSPEYMGSIILLSYILSYCVVVFFILHCKYWLICLQPSSSTLSYTSLWVPWEQVLYLYISVSLLIQCLAHSRSQ